MNLIERIRGSRRTEIQPQINEDAVLMESKLSPTRRFLHGGAAALGFATGIAVAIVGDVAAAEMYKAGTKDAFVAFAWISNTHALAAFVGSVPFLASAVRNRPLNEALS